MNRKTRLRIRDNKQLRRWKQRTRYECSAEFIAANLYDSTPRNVATQSRDICEVLSVVGSPHECLTSGMPDDHTFQSYLAKMALSALHMNRVNLVWNLIRPRVAGMLPVVMPTGDGAMQMSWTRNNRHVSVDVYEDHWDWFFRNRTTDEIDGEDVVKPDSLPGLLATHLKTLGLNPPSSYSREDDDFTDDGCRRKYEYTDDGPRY